MSRENLSKTSASPRLTRRADSVHIKCLDKPYNVTSSSPQDKLNKIHIFLCFSNCIFFSVCFLYLVIGGERTPGAWSVWPRGRREAAQGSCINQVHVLEYGNAVSPNCDLE